MGYIFDAINLNDDDPPSRREDESQSVNDDIHSLDAEPSVESVENNDLVELTYHAHEDQAPADTMVAELDEPAAIAMTTEQSGPIHEMFDDRLVSVTEPSSIMAEEYRSIRTSLLARWEQKRHLVHTITSATPQEGKTLTSMNLGLTFAELRNRRAIVIEADLRLPTFDKLLGIESKIGLIDYLQGNASIDQIIQKVSDHPLHVITAGGHTHGDAVQLLSNQRMAQLMNQLRQQYDHVIVDTPPVVELADAGIVGSMSDDVMLVVRMNRTPRTLIEQAIRTLQSYNAPVAGTISTDHSRSRHKSYYHRYGYRYRDGYGYLNTIRHAA